MRLRKALFYGSFGLVGLIMAAATEAEGEDIYYAEGKGPLILRLVTTGVVAGLCAVLALFAIILIPIPGVPGGSGFWIPAGFYFVFTLWFGIWGALGGHIATFIGMGYFNGFTFITWANGALGDFIAPMVTLIFFRVFGGDPELSKFKPKDWILWLVSVPIASLVCGLWVHSINLFFGVTTLPFWWTGVIAYLIGDSLAVFIIGTPILLALTPMVKRTPAYVRGFF